MKNKQIIILSLAGLFIFMLITALFMYLAPKQNIIVQTPDEKIIYLQQECTSKKCEQDNFQLIETPTQNIVNAKVFGTIYEDRDNATIWGTCSNSENKPLDSNATIIVYYPNSSILVNRSNMSIVDTGRFNLTVELASTRGNYLIMLNCSDGNNHAVAYAEFQNPNWVNKIQNIVSGVGDVMGKKDFRVDKLTAVSPIYPNETVFVEATFSDGNGSLIIPDEINLTVLYPNRSLFITKSKADFSVINNVWNYSEKTTSNQKTGTYFVQLWANDSVNRKSVKTMQFRIATGGPYRLAVDCTAVIEAGTALSCVVDITDEGEIPTESTTAVWIDTLGDGELSSTEPQTSFSKETVPQQIVSETATLNVPISHPTGNFVVRVVTKYLGSTQPDSTASDSITVISKAISGGAVGDGTSGVSSNCNRFIIAYNTCYYFNGVNGCVKGCPSSQKCNTQLQCADDNQSLSQQYPKNLIRSPLQRFWDWLRGLLGLSLNNPELSIIEGSAPTPIKENIHLFDNIKEKTSQAFQQNKWLPYLIVGIALAGFAAYVFGLWRYPLMWLMGMGLWGYILIFILFIMIYLFFRYF